MRPLGRSWEKRKYICAKRKQFGQGLWSVLVSQLRRTYGTIYEYPKLNTLIRALFRNFLDFFEDPFC